MAYGLPLQACLCAQLIGIKDIDTAFHSSGRALLRSPGHRGCALIPSCLLNRCCNTCEDVREAYRRRGWAFKNPDTIEQCRREGFSQKMQEQKNEGCQVYGFLEVNKVSGGNWVSRAGRAL